MVNPYPQLPFDKAENALQEYPPNKLAYQRYSSENASTSSVISVSHNTTMLEVTAVGGAAVLKWIPTSDTAASVVSAASGANFDNVIAPNSTVRYAIPIESQGTGNQSVVGQNRQNGLYQRVAYKTVGIASVLVAEF